MKKCFKIILCLTLALLIFINPYQQIKQAEAIIPAVLATPEALAIAGGLLTAAGITFVDEDALKASAYKYYSEASTSIRQSIDDAASSAMNGLANVAIGVTLWDSLRRFAYDFESGQQIEYLVEGDSAYWDPDVTTETFLIDNKYGTVTQFINEADTAGGYASVTIGTNTVDCRYSNSVVKKGDTWFYYRQITILQNAFLGLSQPIMLKYLEQSTPTHAPDESLFLPFSVDFMLDADSLTILYNGSIVGSFTGTFPPFTKAGSISLGGTVTLYDIGLVDIVESDFMKDPLLDDPRWDLIGSTLALSTALLDQLNKTPTDIVNNTTITYPDTPYPNQDTEVGLLGALLNGLGSLQNTVSTGITTVMTGVNTLVTTFTTGVVGDTSTIRWSDLELTGTFFTTKFPFSLPWDIKNSLTGLSSSSWDGIFTIDLTSHIPGFLMTLNFSAWSGVLAVVRFIELMLFDIGMIYGTTKLLGGDS